MISRQENLIRFPLSLEIQIPQINGMLILDRFLLEHMQLLRTGVIPGGNYGIMMELGMILLQDLMAQFEGNFVYMVVLNLWDVLQ